MRAVAYRHLSSARLQALQRHATREMTAIQAKSLLWLDLYPRPLDQVPCWRLPEPGDLPGHQGASHPDMHSKALWSDIGDCEGLPYDWDRMPDSRYTSTWRRGMDAYCVPILGMAQEHVLCILRAHPVCYRQHGSCLRKTWTSIACHPRALARTQPT